MKRFALSIVLTLFIVLCIGTYYIQASVRLPDFRLETIEGDAEQVSNIAVYAQLGERPRSETILIDTEGSHYENQKSIFLRSNNYWFWGYDEIEQITKEHRSFMRGKNIHASFYNSDSFLVYANVERIKHDGNKLAQRFNVSILDKQAKRTSNAVIDVPDSHLYERGDILNMQVVGERINVIAFQQFAASNFKKQVVRYEIDLNTMELLQSKILMDLDVETNLMHVRDNKMTPSEYIVFQTTTVSRDGEDISDHHTNVAPVNNSLTRQFHIHHLPSGETITPPDAVNDFASTTDGHLFLTSFTGERIYMTKQIDHGLQLLEYDLDTEETKQHHIQITEIDNLFLKNGYLYIFSRDSADDNLPSLTLFDAASGERLYRGKIVLNRSSNGSTSNDSNPLSQLIVLGLVIH